LRLLAALKGADALTDLKSARIDGYSSNSLQLRATALRGVDSASRLRLASYWFREEIARASEYICVLIFATIFYLRLLSIKNTWMSQEKGRAPQDTPSTEAWEQYALAFGWPIAITLALLILRWPQLVRAVALSWQATFVYLNWLNLICAAIFGLILIATISFLVGLMAGAMLFIYSALNFFAIGIAILAIKAVAENQVSRIYAAQLIYRDLSQQTADRDTTRLMFGRAATAISILFLIYTIGLCIITWGKIFGAFLFTTDE